MADDNLGSAGAADSGAGTGAAEAGTGSGNATPIAITETAQFTYPGAKSPTTWKDFSGSYVSKADLTRMRQEDAARNQEWQRTEAARIRQEIEQQQRQQTGQQQGQQSAQDFLQALSKKPYVTGQEMAGFVQEVGTMIAQNQKAMQLLQRENAQLRNSVNGVTGQWSQKERSAMFTTTKTKLNLSDDWDDTLQDVYDAYEGWEKPGNEGEFERLVGERVRKIQAAIRNGDKRKAEEARAQTRPFGQQPTAPARRALLKGNESVEERAKKLWPGHATTADA